MGSIRTDHDGPISFEGAGVKDVFIGLRDFRNLTREKALEAFRVGLAADPNRFDEEEVQAAILEALSHDAWEARQGGLLAAAETLKVQDRPSFRSALLEHVPRLLIDSEYRVRKAVAPVLEECCRRDGLKVYDALEPVVLGDIREKFQRPAEEEDSSADPNAPPAPPTFLPDTEGWRSLETSMGALQAMMQGCGVEFTPRITEEMISLLTECSKHTNRFVREYAFFSLKNSFEVCRKDVFLSTVGPNTVDVVQAGIIDNWSQVRFAGSVAARAFMAKAGEEAERFYPKLLGNMCLNRHYVAEGVRLYSQDTWKQICGPQGGARLLVAHFDSVIDSYVAAAEAPNHAVREAACNCISELASRVAGSPEHPTAHRAAFTPERIDRLLDTLIKLFQDESWPVRDVASLALGHFVVGFPKDCEPYREEFLDLWFDQMADNIPSMRKNGAVAMSMAVKTWTELWPVVLHRLGDTLTAVTGQKENSEIFAQYTPSGPFSVAKPKKASLEDQPDPAFSNQTMYSCGSVAPKTFKRRERRKDGGCMNCSNDLPKQPWEASEGMVHLLAEMASLAASGVFADKEQKKNDVDAVMPGLVTAFECHHFRHQYLLKQRICERLPDISTALGAERMKVHLPKLLKGVVECKKQETHGNLRQNAEVTLSTWRSLFGRGDLEAACEAAELPVAALQ